MAITICHFVIPFVVGSQHARQAIFKAKRKRKVGDKSLKADKSTESDGERIVIEVVFHFVLLKAVVASGFVGDHLIVFSFVNAVHGINTYWEVSANINVKDVLG